MTNGTSQGLFIVVAIVIFGIFVLLSQTLFGDQLSNGLVGLFDVSIGQVEDNFNFSKNLIRDGNFRGYTEADFDWDTELNGSLRPSENWYMGYNKGVSLYRLGYHTHINVDKFGKPVMSFINKNNTVPELHIEPNRWLGTHYTFDTESDMFDYLEHGSEMLVRFDLWSESEDGYLRVGIFQRDDDGREHQVLGTDRVFVRSTQSETWETLETTFVIPDTLNLDRDFRIYFYGHHDNHIEKYMDNVEVRIRK